MKAKIIAYQEYLKGLKFSTESIRRYVGMLKIFLEWKENENLETVEYSDLLTFIRLCQSEGKSTIRINKYLLAVRHYFDWKMQEGNLNTNPATGLQIRGEQQKVKQGFLDKKELCELLGKYEGKRQVILSLLIYQGLTLAELKMLEPSHLDLNKGTIYIPSGRKSNSRTLKLEASQILPLAKLSEKSQTRLINIKSLHNTAFYLCKELRKINPKVRNVRQIRSSVIALWLKTENLREVQYKAGHKHVVSTEMYLQEHLEGLKQQIQQHHPMQTVARSP